MILQVCFNCMNLLISVSSPFLVMVLANIAWELTQRITKPVRFWDSFKVINSKSTLFSAPLGVIYGFSIWSNTLRESVIRTPPTCFTWESTSCKSHTWPHISDHWYLIRNIVSSASIAALASAAPGDLHTRSIFPLCQYKGDMRSISPSSNFFPDMPTKIPFVLLPSGRFWELASHQQ